MTRRRLQRTAMPQSWRPVTEHKVEQFGDVVITTEVVNPSKSSRYYNIYTYGQLFGTAHSLADAKYQVEVIYGPLRWHRQPNPPVEVIHYYFGRTTEFTEPTTIYTADLPMLGYAASRRSTAGSGIYGDYSTPTHRRVYRGLNVPKPQGFQRRWLKLNFGTKTVSEQEDWDNWQRIAQQILRDIQSETNVHWSEDKAVSIRFANSHQATGIPILITGWVKRGAESYLYDGPTAFPDESEITLSDQQTVEVDGVYLLREGGGEYQTLTLDIFRARSASDVLRMSASKRNATHKTASKTYYRGISLYPYPKGLRKAIDNRDTNQARQLILDALDPDEVGVWWTPKFAEAERFGGVVLVGQTDAQLDSRYARFPAGTIITLTDILVNMPNENRPMMTIPDGYSWRSVLDRPMQVKATCKTASKTYYHGTIWTLRSTLLPPSQTGSPANYMAGIGDPNTVYVTTDKAEAYWWGVVSAVASGFPAIQPKVYEITDLVNPRESTLYPGHEMLADSGTVGREVTEPAKHEFKRFLAKSKWELVQDVMPQHVERYAPYLLTAARKNASLPSNMFWRAHPRTRPFDSGSASSTPIGNEWHQDYFGGTRQGFSAAHDPWQLHHYIIDTGLDVSNSDIIAFRGKEVGQGVDGEPLVMPEGAPEYSQSWAGFLADLTRTPLPDINEPSKQPYAYRNSPSSINPWLAIVLYDNTDNSFYQQVLLPRIQSGQVPVFPEWLSKEDAAEEWEYFFGGTVQDAIEEFPALNKFFATRKTGSTSGPYYHGTPFNISIGDVILSPSRDPMLLTNFNMSRGDRVYLTNDIGEAYGWAALASASKSFNVSPKVYRVDEVENPQVGSAMGQFELLADSAVVVEDVTEQAKEAWRAKGANRYELLVGAGAIEDTPRNRGYYLASTRKTGNYLSQIDPHAQHPDTRYAMNLITEALAALPSNHALSLAKQVRIYLAGKPNPDSEKEQAIQRFLIRYADKILKSHGDYPSASVTEYHANELRHAWEALAPHL